jgi:hypothetical protein
LPPRSSSRAQAPRSRRRPPRAIWLQRSPRTSRSSQARHLSRARPAEARTRSRRAGSPASRPTARAMRSEDSLNAGDLRTCLIERRRRGLRSRRRRKGGEAPPPSGEDDRRQLTTAVRIVRLCAVRGPESDRCRAKIGLERDNFWQRQSCRQPDPARLLDRRGEGWLAAEPPLGSSPLTRSGTGASRPRSGMDFGLGRSCRTAPTTRRARSDRSVRRPGRPTARSERQQARTAKPGGVSSRDTPFSGRLLRSSRRLD